MSYEDGIYFGLAEEPYHADPALGSTDIKKLALSPASYWFGSALDPEPKEPEEEKDHLIIGSAVHKYTLEGAPAFHALYEREATGDDLLRTSDALAAWLKAACETNAEAMQEIGLSPKIAGTKQARITQITDLCERLSLDPPRILDVIEAEAALRGRTILKAAAFDRICKAAGSVLGNPNLSASFVGGMPEVSVFWSETVHGVPVRRKCRFDYLKPRAVVDLKSTRPRDGMLFDASCINAMANFGYPTQASAYTDGRQLVPLLVNEGRVFGDHDPAWLKRVADATAFAFVFVFWASGGPPMTWGTILSPGNPVLDVGAEYVRRGLENYAAAMAEYGPGNPWFTPAALEELSFDRMPRWWGAPAAAA